MNKFTKDYKKAENFLSRNKREVLQTSRFIQNALIPFIKDLQKSNPNISIEDFNILLEKETFNLAKAAFKSTYAMDYYMNYIICEYLEKKPDLCRKLYNNFNIDNLDDHDKQFISTPNHSLKDYLDRFMYSVVPEYHDELKGFEKLLEKDSVLKYALSFGKNSDEFKKYLKGFKISKQREYFETFIKYSTTGDLYAYLPEYKSFVRGKLKDILISSITQIASQLNKLHLFEKYNDIEDRNYKKLGLSEIATAKQKKDLKNPKLLKFDLTNPELLKDLTINELMILDSFWINRYAKELNNYCNGIMTVHSLGLLPKILNDTISASDIKPEYVSEALKKCSMLKFHMHLYHTEMQKKYNYGELTKVEYSCPPEEMYIKSISGELKENEYFSSDDGNFLVYSFISFANSMERKYGEEYNNYFSFLPGKTKLEDDAKLYGRLISPEICIYLTKDEVLNCLVYYLENHLEDNKNSINVVNAGIIPDNISQKGNCAFLDPNSICLGLDAKFTFPVTEHIKLSVLKDFLYALHDGTDIFVPLYEGHGDFTYKDGQFITAQQIFPTFKEYEKIVRKLSTNNRSSNPLVDHLYWLIKPSNVPDKYKASEINPKNGKTKKQFYRRYINLAEHRLGQPFQIYVLKDKKYIPVQESNIIFPNIDSIVPEKIGRRN